jgi:hypothetical protein
MSHNNALNNLNFSWHDYNCFESNCRDPTSWCFPLKRHCKFCKWWWKWYWLLPWENLLNNVDTWLGDDLDSKCVTNSIRNWIDFCSSWQKRLFGYTYWHSDCKRFRKYHNACNFKFHNHNFRLRNNKLYSEYAACWPDLYYWWLCSHLVLRLNFCNLSSLVWIWLLLWIRWLKSFCCSNIIGCNIK